MPTPTPTFQLHSAYTPAGDQPLAITQLCQQLSNPATKAVTLLGATGTGKTFTVANVITQLNRPALVLAHNKTLAAQLYNELKGFFPHNAVEYFVSYYDFYQPEAYIPRTDTFIEKSASINDDIDRLRHSATRSLFEHPNVVVVASVSCIYGLGMPDVYLKAALKLEVGESYPREALLHKLIKNQYQRDDLELMRSRFRLRGDVLDVFPANEEWVLRLEFFDEELESLRAIDPSTGEVLEAFDTYMLYPAVHYVTDEDYIDKALAQMKVELKQRSDELRALDKHLEATRLEQRTQRDMDMIKELGYCTGIENYSRIFEGRAAGSPPKTLIDYFPKDLLVVIDESHVTLPQLRGMYHGDKSRKDNLINYGFRLPAARDNRPLTFEEFYSRIDARGQRLYVSATPGAFELQESAAVVEQVIRPTGLLDPLVEVIPTEGQVDRLVQEFTPVLERDERILITTLTKRMAEDLSEYLQGLNLKVAYLHSDIKPMERVEILQSLRMGTVHILIGVNLLREGLDLPEVSLVCIMDADKEGFLRSDHALIQTMGRAARNVAGRVLLFADAITPSMARAMEETQRRREKQMAFNLAHGIVPKTIRKAISNDLLQGMGLDASALAGMNPHSLEGHLGAETPVVLEGEALFSLIAQLEEAMKEAAGVLDFEKAAKLRDQLNALKATVPQSPSVSS